MNQLTEKEKENFVPIEIVANFISIEAKIMATMFVNMQTKINRLENKNDALINYIIRGK